MDTCRYSSAILNKQYILIQSFIWMKLVNQSTYHVVDFIKHWYLQMISCYVIDETFTKPKNLQSWLMILSVCKFQLLVHTGSRFYVICMDNWLVVTLVHVVFRRWYIMLSKYLMYKECFIQNGQYGMSKFVSIRRAKICS